MLTKYLKSPLNYTGGKYKLLSSILPLFPKDINTFVDLFCGGCNVAINAKANSIICNDIMSPVIDLYLCLKEYSISFIIQQIYKGINEYHLSLTNKEGFLKLRDDYNKEHKPLDLFLLICYSFNHMIRFNNKFEYNASFGKNRSQYNITIENNLIEFCKAIKNIDFLNYNAFDMDLSYLDGNDFVYCDPPYLISSASYRDGKRGFGDWTREEELKLYDLLDNLDKQGTRFALSNVLSHKDKNNDLLINWSKKYNINYLNKSLYNNSSYQLKNRESQTEEVLITNY